MIGAWLWPRYPRKDVVVLGAGFSKAVSCYFPLTAELGDDAFKHAEDIPPTERPDEGTGFESWLSRIAEDQPYRSVEENLAAKRNFVKMSEAIGDVLRERQLRALGAPAPGWLDELLSVLHALEATVVSFNYDNVVECAVDGHCLADRAPDLGGPQKVTSHDIVDRLPPLPPAIGSEELPRLGTVLDALSGGPIPMPRDPSRLARSFRLLKLHGSLSWYWSPDDQTGVTLQRRRAPGTFGAAAGGDEDARRRALPGRVPFIVPPTATKSSYLTNLVVREIWGRARAALEDATRVIVIGYSVPAEDQVAGGMLAAALRGRAVEVVVVDPDADQVLDRLGRLVTTATSAKCFTGCSCVEDFVAWYSDERSREAVVALRTWLSEAGFDDAVGHGGGAKETPAQIEGQVRAAWGPCDQPSCRTSHPLFSHWADVEIPAAGPDKNGDLPLRLAPPGFRREVDQKQVPTLLEHLSGPNEVRRIVVQTASGQKYPVVDYATSQPQRYADGNTTHETTRHLTLVPSSHPRLRAAAVK